jgi:hypothetical protein
VAIDVVTVALGPATTSASFINTTQGGLYQPACRFFMETTRKLPGSINIRSISMHRVFIERPCFYTVRYHTPKLFPVSDVDELVSKR